MKSITANLAESFNLFSLVSVIIGAGGAILAITNNNHIVGAALALLGVVSVPLQSWLSSLVVVVPNAVYAELLKVYVGLTVFLGAAAAINQWVLSYDPSLRPVISFLIALSALVVTVFAQLFHASVSQKATRRVAHG